MIMRKIKAQPLMPETFNRFGSYVNMLEPSGDYIGEKPVLFYHDSVTMPFLEQRQHFQFWKFTSRIK